MQGSLLPGEDLCKSGLGSRTEAGYLCSDTGLATQHHSTHEHVRSATRPQTRHAGKGAGPRLTCSTCSLQGPQQSNQNPRELAFQPRSLRLRAPRAPTTDRIQTAGRPAGAEPTWEVRRPSSYLIPFHFFKKGVFVNESLKAVGLADLQSCLLLEGEGVAVCFITPGVNARLQCTDSAVISRKCNTDVGIKIAMKEGAHSSLITYNMYIPIGRLFKEPRLECQNSIRCPCALPHDRLYFPHVHPLTGKEENSIVPSPGCILESPGELLKCTDIHLQRL